MKKQFKKISKIPYYIYDKYLYIDLKNRNLIQILFSNFDFMENQFNNIIIKNKYKLILNSKNKNNNQIEIELYLNKLIDSNFSQLKEIT